MTMNGARDARFADWWNGTGRHLGVSPYTARDIWLAGHSAAMGQQYHRRHDDPQDEELREFAQEANHD